MIATPSLLPFSALFGLVVGLLMGQVSRADGAKQEKNPIVWYVNPNAGHDEASGQSEQAAWRSFEPLNRTPLSPGDEVRIAPGHHSQALVPQAKGTETQPITIRFLPGRHAFSPGGAACRAYFVSNSCDTPEHPMPIGILVKDCEHLNLLGAEEGPPSLLLMEGRMTHFINDHSQSITYRHLTFDLARPTVSELRVVANGDNWADVRIAEGSSHELRDGRLVWTGEIGSGKLLMQQAIPAEGRAWRSSSKNDPLVRATRIESLDQDCYRLHYDNNPPLAGHQFQWRLTTRDVVGAHNTRCRDISLSDCTFHAFAGMGIISQFTDTIHIERVKVMPPRNTLRTCPAWADVFHFSGCRGQITIKDCVVSGTQDDMVNVHGTYLRIVEARGERQLLVRFMHHQTRGFAAFVPGDEIAVIDAGTLREIPDQPHRKVVAIERISDHDWLLTLDGGIIAHGPDAVIENLSWYPELEVSGCHLDMDSCRGVLVSTPRKVIIERNRFHRCRMPAILIADDANSWFESGPVRDVTIRNNTFFGCGISITPEVRKGKEPVHENIRITGNTFLEGAGIEAHHAAGLVISDNRSDRGELPIKLDPQSTRAVLTNNGGGLKGGALTIEE